MAISSYEWRMFHNAPPSDSQSFEVLETDDGVRILCIHNIPSTATSLHVICISLVWGLRASNTSFAGNWKCESSADLLEVLAIQGAHFSCSSHEIKWREKSCKSFLFFCFRESHQGSPHYSPFSFFYDFFVEFPPLSTKISMKTIIKGILLLSETWIRLPVKKQKNTLSSIISQYTRNKRYFFRTRYVVWCIKFIHFLNLNWKHIFSKSSHWLQLRLTGISDNICNNPKNITDMSRQMQKKVLNKNIFPYRQDRQTHEV